MNYLFLVIFGLIIFGLFLIRRLLHLQTGTLLLGILGVILGALLGALFSVPLSRLPGVWGQILPTATTIVLAGVLAIVFIFQKEKISYWYSQSFLKNLEERFLKLEKKIIRLPEKAIPRMTGFPEKVPEKIEKEREEDKGGIIVDTSVLIDGRLGGIVKSSFILEKLIIPQFILEELQKVADSSDNLKRNRGRRGLEVLKEIQNDKNVKVEILDINYPKIKDIDQKLLKLAKERKGVILTVDYNLNQVAGIQGIKVLNINELANAVKTILLPGEIIKIKIIQEGKEKDQGIGYLEDGTMIVVEGGKDLVGQEIEVKVERIFQTVAGRMIFTSPIK